jgi:phenylpyruvate tautomerase PptA (4-oxalocrotonate tautomerase family)
MPLITLTVRKPKTSDFKSGVFDAVHKALVASGVPQADRFQRVLELDADNFRADPTYPDVATKRGADFVLVEILWSVGRSVKIKRKLVADIVRALSLAPGLDPEQVMIVFVETAWENWAFAGGRLLHAA